MPVRLLIPLFIAGALALALAGSAAGRPCQDCEPEGGGGGGPVITPTPTPNVTEERDEVTLTIVSERGRVSDESGVECAPGTCTRARTYTRTCTDGRCPPYDYEPMALKLRTEPGYSAKWDGCTPQADPAACKVQLDGDKTVTVLWTKVPGMDGTVERDPVHDGGAIDPSAGLVEGTTVSGTVDVRAQVKRGAIRSTLRYSFRRSATWTEFTRLTVRHIPRGATTRVSCKGQGCPTGATVSKQAGRVDLKRYTSRRYGVGAALTVRVAKTGKEARTTRMVVRRGRDPRVTHP